MATTFQIVDETDLTTVLFDLNDPTGANNPHGVQTGFGLGGSFALLAPETEFSYVGSASVPGGRVVNRRDPLVESSFRLRATAASFDDLSAGINELSLLLASGGVIKWVPHGSSETRYIDFVPSKTPALFEGQDLELPHALRLFSLPQGVTILLTRQPYLRGPLIDSDVNLLQNSMLLIDRADDGRPDLWVWDSTTNISSESIDSANEAYKFDIATTSTRNLEQTTATGSFAPSDVATFSFYAKASAGGTARVRAVVRFKDSGGGDLGTEQQSSQVTLTTSWQRITVTTSAAPASTSKAECSVRFENVAATSVTVYLNRAQMEEASSASLFRVGSQDTSNDPTTAGKGRTFPVYIHGSAPTFVEATIENAGPSSGLVSSLRWASALSGGRTGRYHLADCVNHDWIAADDYTTGPDMLREQTDADAASGVAVGCHEIRQMKVAHGSGQYPTVSWDMATLDGNFLMMYLFIDSNGTSPSTTSPSGWTLAKQSSSTTAAHRLSYISDAAPRSGAEQWDITNYVAHTWAIAILEIDGGADYKTYFYQEDGITVAGTSDTPETGSTTWTDETPYLNIGFTGSEGGSGEHQLTGRGTFLYASDEASNPNLSIYGFFIEDGEGYGTNNHDFGVVSWATSKYHASGTFSVTVNGVPFPGVNQRRARYQITTTDLDHYRGRTFDVILRARVTGHDRWALQLRWGATDEGSSVNCPPVALDREGATEFDGYEEVILGQIACPDRSLSAITLDVWAERTSTVEHVANYNFGDLPADGGLWLAELYLSPADHTRTLLVGAGTGSEEWLGMNCVSPVTNPAGGTLMDIDGSSRVSNAQNDNCGTPPNSGVKWGAGLHQFEFNITAHASGVQDGSYTIRVRNITDSTTVAERTVIVPEGGGDSTDTHRLMADLADGKAYQAQFQTVEIGMMGAYYLNSISHTANPGFGQYECAETIPDIPETVVLDSDQDFLFDLEAYGPVPDILEPGLNIGSVVLLDVIPSGWVNAESELTRIGSVRTRYHPRYYS